MSVAVCACVLMYDSRMHILGPSSFCYSDFDFENLADATTAAIYSL